ncbi:MULTISPECIES: ATP-grasp domain-containing protein [Streptomyces]|uniref:ATP-grasp domain-containing protein n=1 Tax=Streptomyces TaxID=1883 RepID=UPI000886D19D|nr:MULTISPECIES: ATP-grasp domain-containing protein [unclassified Streptomyces griseus subgroup]MYW77754.1 ATP-grasp domain-containing protein [Streptomyces sp. SID8369]QSS94819.1 ATP-grasp domain-containing protein [Streptomyces sp. M54]SDC47467.1 Biotin carboxylase [Streptomyces sp. LaPpAH-199]
MSPRYVVFIDSPWTGAGQDCARFLLEQGITPLILAADPAHLHPSLLHDYAELGVAIHACDVDSADAIVAFCDDLATRGEVVGVTSVYEYYCDMGARVAARLGLAGPAPEAVAICRSKSAMREAMAPVPGLNPLFRVAESPEEAAAAADAIGYPVVVKPLDLTGSLFVRRCENAEDVTAITAEVMGLGEYLGHEVTPKVIVEECVLGAEYSAEIVHGKVLGLTEKIGSEPPLFLEMGHVFPAALPGEQERLLVEKAELAVKAVGITWGPSHVELKLTADGKDARVIEVNGRIAGDRIPEAVRIASGVDMCRLHMTALLGGAPDLTLTADRTAAIHFLMLKSSGHLDAIDGVEEALALEGVREVHLRPGVQAGIDYRANGSNRDRAAWIITEGADRDQALARAHKAGDTLTFTWSPLSETDAEA